MPMNPSTRITRLLVAAVLALVGAGCSSEPIVVQGGRVAPPEEVQAQLDELAPEPETILAPDFELQLEPGQDPDEILDFGFDELDLDDLEGDEPSLDVGSPEGPDDAIVSLCPAVARLVGDDAGESAGDEVDALTRATPDPWRAQLESIDATAFDPAAPPPEIDVAGLDGYYYDTCSVPLFAGATQLRAGCVGVSAGADGRSCSRARVEDELGGLCFDEAAPAGQTRVFVLLSCVSGLPAN